MTVAEAFNRLDAAVRSGRVHAPAGRTPKGLRQAAVLALFDSGHGPDVDDLALTFVEKSANLRRHAGQIAFPGGSVDPSDADIVATAMREAHEEVGLEAHDVTIKTLLPAASLPSGYDVTAVVAHSHDTPTLFVNDAGEIAAIHRVPVAALVDPANRFTATLEGHGDIGPGFGIRADERPGVFIWGLTAYLLDLILDATGLAHAWERRRRVPIPKQYR